MLEWIMTRYEIVLVNASWLVLIFFHGGSRYLTRCKDVTQKDDIGATQAVRLNTTVKQLKKLFLSRKTKTDWLEKNGQKKMPLRRLENNVVFSHL